MVYVKTTWTELAMTTSNKLYGLNNMETMNTEGVSYITGVLHAERYYTDAQAEAKFFYSGNDGTGSGAICATLDGYTADEVIATGIPTGIIALWSGSVADIPTGWYLCDGTIYGTVVTPNLRNKFVVGVGQSYTAKDEGGSATVTMNATPTIASHALVNTEVPKHTHGTIVDTYPVQPSAYKYSTGSVGYKLMVLTVADVTRATGSTGNGTAHTHTSSWTPTAGQSKLPSYYAICYIMRG